MPVDEIAIERRLAGIESLLRQIAGKHASDRMLTARDVDRLYRLRNGTAIRACKAGLIRCREVPAKGGHHTFLIAPSDAQQFWGPK